MIPPPADFVNGKTDYVAGQVAHHISQAASGASELFVRATVDVSHRDQEIRGLKEKVGHLEAHDLVGLQALHRVTAWATTEGNMLCRSLFTRHSQMVLRTGSRSMHCYLSRFLCLVQSPLVIFM
nr:uncharacterized protein LOC109149872 [Ipomoea batatas]